MSENLETRSNVPAVAVRVNRILDENIFVFLTLDHALSDLPETRLVVDY